MSLMQGVEKGDPIPQAVPCNEDMMPTTEIKDLTMNDPCYQVEPVRVLDEIPIEQQPCSIIDDGAVLDTLEGLSCLAPWILSDVRLVRTTSRFEVIVKYDRDKALGNINKNLDEVTEALKMLHKCPYGLPVAMVFESSS